MMKIKAMIAVLIPLLTYACGDETKAGNVDAQSVDAHALVDSRVSDNPKCPASGEVAIDLMTDDGVSLIADLYPAEDPTGPGLILLHMIPPSNSKANYPVSFAKAFQERGFTVINVNRRGAPGSGGEAADAYRGPSGKFDAKAAYDYLKSECGISSYSMVGASNGTTTVLDFSVYAAETLGIETPDSIVMLSGGSYTESQHRIADQVDALPQKAYLAYPRSESSWNNGIKAVVLAWEYKEYSPGGHGTGLLTSNPEIVSALLEFIDAP